jgi:hypothetical protein
MGPRAMMITEKVLMETMAIGVCVEGLVFVGLRRGEV